MQARAIEEFGGLHGVRDVGALEAALTAAENRVYDEQASLSVCAATYAYHLTQAHAFLDGNKRIAAAVAEIFLELNGQNCVQLMRKLLPYFWRLRQDRCRARTSSSGSHSGSFSNRSPLHRGNSSFQARVVGHTACASCRRFCTLWSKQHKT